MNLFHPFLKIAGGKALGAGLLMAMASALLALVSPGHFDGVLDLHFTESSSGNWTKPILVNFSENLINVLAAGVIFSIAALLCVGTRFRVIDIFGTMAFARFPLYLGSLLNIGSLFARVSGKLIANPKQPGFADLTLPDWIVFLSGTLLLIPCIVWMIALLYQAYTVSTGLKGSKAIVSFIVALLLAEILSKFIHYSLIPLLL